MAVYGPQSWFNSDKLFLQKNFSFDISFSHI
jgi:hypothetical protein